MRVIYDFSFSLHSARLFHHRDQPDGVNDIWTGYSTARLLRNQFSNMAPLTEFTDDIAEDWGGKPFVDLQKGWKYALEKYPEAGGFVQGSRDNSS